MTPRFTRTIPTLRIFDSGKAREFYIGFLGFKVDFEHRFEPDLPLFMQISMGDIVLYLSEHHGAARLVPRSLSKPRALPHTTPI